MAGESSSGLERPGSTLNIGFAGHVTSFRAAENGGRGFQIGRQDGCLVRLVESAVSRVHVNVFPRRSADGFQWAVEDNASSNGTWIDRGARRLVPRVPHWFDNQVELRLYDAELGPRITLVVASELTVKAAPNLGLTIKEREILAGLRAGLTDRQMAELLFTGEDAIHKRFVRLRDKLAAQFDGVRPSRAQLGELAAALDIERLSGPL